MNLLLGSFVYSFVLWQDSHFVPVACAWSLPSPWSRDLPPHSRSHYVPTRDPTFSRHQSLRSLFVNRSRKLFSIQTPSKDENDSAQALSRALLEQAKRAKVEADKMESELNLFKISKLEKTLKGKNLTASELRNIRSEIINLVRLVDPSISVPDSTHMEKEGETKGNSSPMLLKSGRSEPAAEDNQDNTISEDELSEHEFEDAVAYFVSLPRPIRMTLASVVQLDLDTIDPSVIVLCLYELGDEIPVETYASTYNSILEVTESIASRGIGRSNRKMGDSDSSTIVTDILGKTPEEYKADSLIESLLPRVTRNKGKEPTKEDVDLFVKMACGKDTFMVSSVAEKIPGGYVVRGNNQLKDGTQLIQALDLKLQSSAPEWSEKFQANFILDPTRTNVEDTSVDGDPVLLITSTDFSPATNRLILTAVSSISLFLSFLFCIATFGSNEVVMKRITEANALENYDITWFNELLMPLVGVIAFIQLVHECGHYFFAWKDKFQMLPPTILPIISLPYLSFQTKLKASPPDFSSLFNFAFTGPFLGMITSALFLLIGLKLTIAMDPNEVQYAPSLPVALIRLSTLGENVSSGLLYN